MYYRIFLTSGLYIFPLEYYQVGRKAVERIEKF